MSAQLIDRRDFLKSTVFFSSTFLLGLGGVEAAPNLGAFSPNGFLSIDPKSGIKVYIPVPEIGQNIRTTLSMGVIDELDISIEKVEVVQAQLDISYGQQMAAGSGSSRKHFMNMRNSGAAARQMLINAAAKKFKVAANKCKTADGYVILPNKKKVSYESLASLAAKEKVPAKPRLKQAKDFNYIGKSKNRTIDAESIVTGDMTFSMDADLPNLHYATVIAPPVYRETLGRVDSKEAEAFPGVVNVVKLKNKIAVVAKNTWAAIEGAKKVKATWNKGRGQKVSTEDLEKLALSSFEKAKEAGKSGDFDAEFKKSSSKLELEFKTPNMLHATMEPANCTAYVTKDKAEVLVGCQNQNKLRDGVFADATGQPLEKINYQSLRMGGSFGRKLSTIFVTDAIEISKATGLPIKMTYTREYETSTADAHRRMSLYIYRIGLDNNGMPLAVEKYSTTKPKGNRDNDDIVKLSRANLTKISRFVTPLSGGVLRAPGKNEQYFIWESTIDIMANKANVDPLIYRLALYGDTDSYRLLKWRRSPQKDPIRVALYKKVAEMAGWNKNSDYGYGIAYGSGYGSHCAMVALAPKKKGGKLIEKFYAAVSCGDVINPSGAKAQVEGGILDAMGAALHQEITLDGGKVMQSNFHDYPLLRMPEMADIEVEFVDGLQESLGGLGEISYPMTSPAICNALNAAHGKRITELPIANQLDS